MNSAPFPLPVAGLRRRSHNAKSAKDLHDTAYYAWEVSVRIAVAASPPEDPMPLVRSSLGRWVDALDLEDRSFDDPDLAETYALITGEGRGRQARPKSVTARQLLEALPPYRNRIVGHGGVRSGEFYDRAGNILRRGIDAAWKEGVFLPISSRMLYVDSVEVGLDGRHRARVFDLTGEHPLVLDPSGTPVPEGLVPERLYLRDGTTWRSLHPWLLYTAEDERERVLFFDTVRRTHARYLDYASGEMLRGPALEAVFPGIVEDLQRVFGHWKPTDLEEATEADANRLGDYVILDLLGEGGMGKVHLALQESVGRLVAVKTLPMEAANNPEAVARFRREVAALSRCEHPNVVKILTSGKARGTNYYAMEYVEGADLSHIAAALSQSPDDFDVAVRNACTKDGGSPEGDETTPVPATHTKATPIDEFTGDRIRRVAAIFRDAARGLHHLHEKGVVHRDIKPANIVVTAHGHRPVVMDLGLATIADASQVITEDRSQLIGTLRYLPPEQLQRDLVQTDRRADIYSLGATLYELVTDRPFFDGQTAARLIEQ
ncbi:MAG: serine/threonine protein kinase, partial [bacterium]|nr:serine/threonine protein kinase [bacterium]